jgi:hypothetical protein
MPNTLHRTRVVRQPPRYALPRLIWQGSAATGGALAPSGTLAGDLNVGVDSAATTTPPTTVATGGTWIDAGIASDESAADAAIRAAYLVSVGADDAIGAAGASRRSWVTLRDVDVPMFIAYLAAGITYAYDATTGANILTPALGGWPRPGVVLLWVRQSSTNTNTFTKPPTLIATQNAANAEMQVYWTGASASLATQGAEVAAYDSQSQAITDSTRPRCTFALWVPGIRL